MPNVLLTSAGRRVALLRAFRAAVASVGGGRVLAADAGGTAAAIHEADEGFVVPRCDSPDYVPALLAICRRESVALVVPTIDPELPVLARARQAFARAGVLVAASGPATNDIAFDKANTAAFFDREGIPAPRQLDLGGAVAGRDGFAFPVALKPRFGSGSVGVHIVRELDELRFYARRVPEPLLQEYVEGVEFTLDVLVGPDGRAARRGDRGVGPDRLRAAARRRRPAHAAVLPAARRTPRVHRDQPALRRRLPALPACRRRLPALAARVGARPALDGEPGGVAGGRGHAPLRRRDLRLARGARVIALRVVVFDLDDTLFPERDYVRSGFAALEDEVRRVFGASAFGAVAWELFEAGVRGRIIDAALARLGLPADAATVGSLVDCYRRHRPSIGLYPDVAPVMRCLSRRV
ncbi:MAG: ATP-grasp domain-containing protein, partial [Deltaproteobacteria bacterium]